MFQSARKHMRSIAMLGVAAALVSAASRRAGGFAVLRIGDRTLVATELGQVDVLQGLPQVPPFATLDEMAKDVGLDGLGVGGRSGEGPEGEMTSPGATLSRLDLPVRLV